MMTSKSKQSGFIPTPTFKQSWGKKFLSLFGINFNTSICSAVGRKQSLQHKSGCNGLAPTLKLMWLKLWYKLTRIFKRVGKVSSNLSHNVSAAQRHQFECRGFTLVEMIVAMAVFSVVVTIAVGALLAMIASNGQLQRERNVMTNLSFALDSMSREIRTGTKYYCLSGGSANSGPNGEKIFQDGHVLDADVNRDCFNGTNSNNGYRGISFIEGGQSITEAADTRIVYFYNEDEQKLYRRISGEDAQSIVSSGIVITDANFFVSGSDPHSAGGAGSDNQPAVTVHIEALDADDPDGEPYEVQTTVTQRTLDI